MLYIVAQREHRVRCRSCGLQFHAECDPQEGMRLARHAACAGISVETVFDVRLSVAYEFAVHPVRGESVCSPCRAEAPASKPR
jgi:hypothetical protein